MHVTVETFRPEMLEAMKMYDKYVICIDKTPEEFEASLVSLLNKALTAFASRGPVRWGWLTSALDSSSYLLSQV